MLELEHIQKAFDGVPVLKDLSLQARPPCSISSWASWMPTRERSDTAGRI